MVAYKYIVHSDVDENNIYDEFDTAAEAIDYAREHKDSETYVDKVEVDVNDFGEVTQEYGSERVWSYSDDDDCLADYELKQYEDASMVDPYEADEFGDYINNRFEGLDADKMVEDLEENEDEVECKGCFGLFPKNECVKLEHGYLCKECSSRKSLNEGTGGGFLSEQQLGYFENWLKAGNSAENEYQDEDYNEVSYALDYWDYDNEFSFVYSYYRSSEDNNAEVGPDGNLTDEDSVSAKSLVELVNKADEYLDYIKVLYDKYEDSILALNKGGAADESLNETSVGKPIATGKKSDEELAADLEQTILELEKRGADKKLLDELRAKLTDLKSKKEGLEEAKKDEEELPADPEAVKLEVHQELNDLVADEIEAINGYDEAKADILDAPIEHKDAIIDTIDHIKGEEKEHIDELIGATTEIPFGKGHEEQPVKEMPVDKGQQPKLDMPLEEPAVEGLGKEGTELDEYWWESDDPMNWSDMPHSYFRADSNGKPIVYVDFEYRGRGGPDDHDFDEAKGYIKRYFPEVDINSITFMECEEDLENIGTIYFDDDGYFEKPDDSDNANEDPFSQDFPVKESHPDIPFDSDVKEGDRIRIVHLSDEDSSYDGREGTVEHIDGIGQLHGTWGGLAVIPGVDAFEVIAHEELEDLDEASSATKRAYKNGGSDLDDLLIGRTIASIKTPSVRNAVVDTLQSGDSDKANAIKDLIRRDPRLDDVDNAYIKKADSMQQAGVVAESAEQNEELKKIIHTTTHFIETKYVLCLDDGNGEKYFDGGHDVTDIDHAKRYDTREDAEYHASDASYDYIDGIFDSDWEEAGWEEDTCIFYPEEVTREWDEEDTEEETE